MNPSIQSSVGRGGVNRKTDVQLVQRLLNTKNLVPLVRLTGDGSCGVLTIRAIEEFQRRYVKSVHQDGRIDPGGKSFQLLSNSGSQGGAPSSAACSLSLSSQGSTLLKQVEELRLKPYDDQTRKEITAWVSGATIGYGHLIAKNDWETYKGGITEPAASQLFERDLSPFVSSVRQAIKYGIKQNEFDALVILAFNIGAANFSSSSVVRLVNNPSAVTSYKDLESAWKAWNKSQGKAMKGLDNRRQCEWNIYAKGTYVRW